VLHDGYEEFSTDTADAALTLSAQALASASSNRARCARGDIPDEFVHLASASQVIGTTARTAPLRYRVWPVSATRFSFSITTPMAVATHSSDVSVRAMS
jgi:hypothetical protein